jgi:predicted dehydrogenase
MSSGITRRKFIKGTAAAAGLTVLASTFRTHAYAANEKLNTALIGVGGQGSSSHGAALGENLVAMCDADQGRMADLAKRVPQAKTYTDWRKMLDAHKNINAVFIATPDHTHFPAAYAAINRGMSTYVEKPMTHSIWEARTLAAAARKAKVATQMGNQGHSSEGWRVLCEYVWAGLLGDVTLVECSTDRPIWPQGLERPNRTDPIPPSMNWEAWIGAAPMRPFVNGTYHPFVWRGWLDFGCGALGDMGCHIMDGAFWALKLGEAKTCTVEAEVDAPYKETFPRWTVITYKFPARGKMPPVTLKWYDGGKREPRPPQLEEKRNLAGDGHSIFHGSKNVMVADCYGGSVRIIPESKQRETPRPPRTLPRAGDHRGDFLAACKGGPPASSNFDYAGPFTEMVLLGVLALRLRQPINWDFATMKAAGLPAADAIIHRQYRPGWVNI